MRILIMILLAIAAVGGAEAASPSRATGLRCDYQENPACVDSPKPGLSWKLDDSRTGARQTAYQILVASSKENLAQGKPDLWDSGKIESEQSVEISYAGAALKSRQKCFWQVRVWDKDGTEGKPSEIAAWEMGLLNRADWKAQWIGTEYKLEKAQESTDGVKWLWYPGENAVTSAPKGTRLFKYAFDVPKESKVVKATVWTLADNRFATYLNGSQVSNSGGWQTVSPFTITHHVRPGGNVLAVSVTNETNGPAGVALRLTIQYADGRVETHSTGDGWLAGQKGPDGWTTTTEKLPTWQTAEVLGDIGMKPWGTPSVTSSGGPAQLLRKEFAANKTVSNARVFVTALGSYRLHINGKRVGTDCFTPDWSDYRKRVSYQCYDVTPLVKKGENAIGAILGDGWYASGLGWTLERFAFGKPPLRLLLQLHLQYSDGSEDVVISDGSWKADYAPILRSEIYAGETYDARLEQDGWDQPKFHDEKWKTVELPETSSAIQLSAQVSPPVRVTQYIKPKTITNPAPGIFVYDLEQNMVGWVKLTARGAAGTKIKLRFAEILKPDGNIYTDNLRRAEVTDTYILKGSGTESFEPHFTYHGFRYVEITGYPGDKQPPLDAIVGCVAHTDSPMAGKFETDNKLVNQIWKNTLWGQFGNLFSVPTDCPQRDERLGWMGDAQAFWRTASFNMDLASFTRKWMMDVVEAQSAEGGFSNVAPRVIDVADGAPAWGDAGIIVPYTAWLQYGDTKLIESAWTPMEKWMDYIYAANPNHLWEKRRNHDYGDWVPANSETDKGLIATAYWAYDAQLMAHMARALGRKEDVAKYDTLFGKIRDAFQTKYIAEDGKIANGSQTCYVLALHMNLVPDSKRKLAIKHLVDDITTRSNHLSTGFLGSTYLMPVLSENGRHDLAVTLLLNDTFPSWGYMIRKGATTIWERWNGDTGDPGMNSYNHYCYGAVSEWMYRYLAGIDVNGLTPGYRRINIRPNPDARLKTVNGEFESVYGTIKSAWTLDQTGKFTLQVTVPPNTTATIYVPAASSDDVRLNGKSPHDQGYTTSGFVDKHLVLEMPAGTFKFESKL